jgi:phospholipid/cholesterol/gamma-HCH transport system ATP-binding protein
MIKVINITKIFDCIKVLDNISFEVSGELVAILGPTGEGKTVLLKIIAGLIKPDTGQVIIDKDETFGFVFQHSSLFDSLTVEENIRLPLEECSCLTSTEINERVKSVAGLLNIDQNLLKRSVTEISGGERKIVAIGRAIINNPTYLLYDEPTAGLDPVTHDRICAIIKNLNKPGIVVTHNMETIKQIGAKTICLLKIGRISKLENREVIKEHYE